MDLKHLIYRAKFHAAPYLPLKFPVHVDIELSGKCQLACVMCPYGTGDFDETKQGMMPTHIAHKAIKEAAKGGAKSIKLNFRGEPGLHPNLSHMIAWAKDKGIQEVAINTNLTAFSHRRLQDICFAGLDLIIVSIDGATKETYEKIRVKGDWDKLMENLSYLKGLRKRPHVRVQMVVQEANQHEVDMFLNKFAPLSDEIVTQTVRQDNSGERKRCPQPWQRLIVAWDGTVFACCSNWNNEWPVGRFPEQSLSDIWNGSEALGMLRHRATFFYKNPCKECKVGGSYK